MLTTASSDRPDADGAAAQPGPVRFGWLPKRLVVAAAWAAAGIVLFFAYFGQARTAAASSNSAFEALQSWDMLHGNVLLHGWSLSDVSFYTTELPEYMLVELVRGLNSGVVHVAAALSYALVVLLGALLAKGRATGQEALVRVLVVGVIMLAPPLRIGTYLLLTGPDHIGTQVPLLLIWLVLDRARARWWVPIVVSVLLAWAQVADMIVLVEGVLPLAVVCAVRMCRRRGPLAGQWYELSLAAGALASVVVARLAFAVLRQAGGFFVSTPLVHFSIDAALPPRLWPKTQNLLYVFGASFHRLPYGFAAIAVPLHLFGIVLVVWALAAALRRFFSEDDLIAQMLAVAFIALMAAYMFGSKPDANEVVGLLPIGGVLAGRLLASRLIRTGTVLPLAAVLACFGAVLMFDAGQPAQASKAELARWLQAHHLSYGLAGYWQASTVTVASGDRVQIRPVRMYHHELVTTPEESDASWYDASRHDARFVIWAPRKSCQNVCLSMADLRAEFGPPAVIYRVASYRVLVWRKNLLTDLPTLSWCGHGWPWAAGVKPAPTQCSENLLRL